MENLALIALLSMLYSPKNVLACANWNKEQSISIIQNIVRCFTQTIKDLITDNLCISKYQTRIHYLLYNRKNKLYTAPLKQSNLVVVQCNCIILHCNLWLKTTRATCSFISLSLFMYTILERD